MNGKENIKSIISSFFIIVTLVNIATFILGSVFRPDARFGYDAFLSPIIYGICSLIPFAITYSNRELKLKELLFREVLQLISIEVILCLLAFGGKAINKENISLIISFCVSIFIVYVLVNVITWLLDVKTAKEMTNDLHEYQNNQTHDRGQSA